MPSSSRSSKLPFKRKYGIVQHKHIFFPTIMEEILNDVVSKLRAISRERTAAYVMMQNRWEVRRPDNLADDLITHLFIGENDHFLDHIAAVFLAGVLHHVAEHRPRQQLAFLGASSLQNELEREKEREKKALERRSFRRDW